MKTQQRPWWAYITTLAIFLAFIGTAYLVDVHDYISDSIMLIVIMSLLFWWYNSLRLTPRIYMALTFAFALHNAGVFGFYNISPVGLQWDHVTHFVGEFVAAIFVYNYFKLGNYFKQKTTAERWTLYCLILLSILGFGVFVEFMEFYGYFVVGDGLGVFGHGLGDINTEFINSEWFNTMFDFIYNFFGGLCGILYARFVMKKTSS